MYVVVSYYQGHVQISRTVTRNVFQFDIKRIELTNTATLSRLSQMNHGLGAQINSCNRWFDKTIQFIIGPDGAVGANYEHCSAEGPPAR